MRRETGMELRMKESYVEGLATHGDPESCVRIRKGAGEALTGAHVGEVLSREIKFHRGADAVKRCGRQYRRGRYGESPGDPARSETLCMRGNSMRGNREIPVSPAQDGSGGRIGKAKAATR